MEVESSSDSDTNSKNKSKSNVMCKKLKIFSPTEKYALITKNLAFQKEHHL